jgi:outer membrane protease
MRNINLFRPFVIILAVFFISQPLQAQIFGNFKIDGVPYSLSMETEVGMILGEAHEIVYIYPKNDVYLSFLTWDIKPLFYLGLGLTLAPAKKDAFGIYSSLFVKTGIPGYSGSMVDKDWRVDWKGGPLLGTGALMALSAHDNFTLGALLLDYDLGLSIPLKAKERTFMVLQTFARFSLMYYEWLARDGYTQYPPIGENWSDDVPKLDFYGQAIAYSQVWIIPSPGIGFTVPLLNNRIIPGLSLTVSPYTWVVANDLHLVRQSVDYPVGGIGFDPRFSFSFFPNYFM